MRPTVKIAPSLLAADLARAGAEAERVREAGADCLHVDVLDGHFAPNLSFGPCVVEAINKASDIPLFVHLMVTDPEMFARPYVEAGADDLLFHAELDLDGVALARRIRELGARPGVALEMDTPPETAEHLVGEIGIILVMTVKCGHTGQKFNPEPVAKIPVLRRMFGPDVDIAVDGGVGLDNAADLVAAGANVLVAGKAIFWADDPGEAIAQLRAAGESAVVK
jgi:ribulose-phosphate 3-epimerase